jgi:threonine/homoserine/homoserine lactone efflux protein
MISVLSSSWPAERLAGLVMLVAATTVTPGPNNLMLMASGLNFGVRRSLPAWIGVNVGFGGLLFGVGLGLGAALGRWPALDLALRVGSAGVIGWMAWRLAAAKGSAQGAARPRPVRALEAAAFQWINPKAWLMAVSAIAAYARPEHFWLDLAVIVVGFWIVGSPCNGIWVAFGSALTRRLSDPGRLKWFNRAMAAALALSVAPLLFR